MATTERTSEPAPADEVAASCRDAELVWLVGAPRSDALAATGLLSTALDAIGVPFQASLGRDTTAGATEADITVAIGLQGDGATHAIIPEAGVAVAAALGHTDPVHALIAGGDTAGKAMTLGRRPGLAVPTADPVDGLAHSTLVHGPFSGNPDAARTILGPHADGTDDTARRERASAMVLSVGSKATPASRAGTAIGRVLRPHAGGPLETVEGYADVLDALAKCDSGLGLAAVLGGLDAKTALSTWRDHARSVHESVAAAELRRHDGLAVAEIDTDPTAVESVARLLRDFRSPEATVLVIASDRTALATSGDRDARALLGDHVPVTGHAGVASTQSVTADLENTLADGLEGER